MKKNRFLQKTLTLAAAAALTLTASVPAAAASYTPIPGTETTFEKYLIVSAGDTVPNVTFSYSISAGEEVSADTSDNTVFQILPGVDADKITISDTVFSPEDTDGAVTAVQTGDIDVAREIAERAPGYTAQNGVSFDTDPGEKYVAKTAHVNLTGVSFDEPGVYRYVISETSSETDEAKGVMHDNGTERVLDVYVTDNGSGGLAVSAYVLHTDAASAPRIGRDMGTADALADGEMLADKTDGFTNEYHSRDLVFTAEVDGNQASRDKYFELTLVLSNLTPQDRFDVSVSDDGDPNTTDGNADTVTGKNAATRAANREQPNASSLTAGEDGTVTQKFYLQHGQSVAVRGLPADARYVLTEDPEDYRQTPAGVTGYTDPVEGTMGEIAVTARVVKTSYLNQRDGVIPTGIAMASGTGLAAIAAGTGGIALISALRKRRGTGERHE